MKKYSKYIIAGLVVVLLLLPLLAKVLQNQKPNTINYTEFQASIINNKEVLIYIDNEESKTKEANFKSLNEFRNTSSKTYKYLDVDSLSNADKESLIESVGQELTYPAYVFIKNSGISGIRSGAYTPSELKILADKYFDNYDTNVSYKVPGSMDTFIERAEKDELLMLVLGRTSCIYCENFKPTFNRLASEYQIDTYYFDSDYYDAKEYAKLMNKNYKIPGRSISDKDANEEFSECTNDGKDSTINKGFSTPLSLFIKNGETVDCVLGAISEDRVRTVLDFHNIPKFD